MKWKKGGSARMTRLAFDLWNEYAEQNHEKLSTPYEIV
ncbi:MAG: DUF6075 family protein [Muricomes sp.]